MDEEYLKINNFRKAINDWKRETLFKGLNNEGDKDSIQRRINEAQTLFFNLMKLINDRDTTKQNDNDINTILATLGDSSTWSESLIYNLRHIIFTDLYEYPLTFNTVLIDQFKNQEEEDFPVFQ